MKKTLAPRHDVDTSIPNALKAASSFQEDTRVGAKTPAPAKVLNVPFAGGNPYQQDLMYRSAAPQVECVPAGKGSLLALDVSEHPIVHLHWDDRIFGRSPEAETNAQLLMQSLEAIDSYRQNGGRLVWTIHNAKPHKVIDLAAFEAARKALVTRADAIHVHAPHAKDHMVSEYAADADLIHVIPHPSYLGAYEPSDVTVSRPMPDKAVTQFLFFGMFRGEKGAHKIQDAAAKLTKRGYDFHLRMYGKAFPSQRRLVRMLGWNSNISLRTDRIPDAEIPEIFGASHFFLAPYSSLFSSGTVALAQTFGLPVIGPALREIKEITPPDLHDVLLYDPASPRGLQRTMLRAIDLSESDTSELRAICLKHAQKIAPEQISPQLVDILRPS